VVGTGSSSWVCGVQVGVGKVVLRMLRGWAAHRCEWIAVGAWARQRTTPPAGGPRLVAVGPHRPLQDLMTPHDPLINDLAGGSCCSGRSRNLYIGIDLYIDSDIQISSSTLAPHPSCYQLNVACGLSERRLLINDFAGALPRGAPGRPGTAVNDPRPPSTFTAQDHESPSVLVGTDSS
jgi:hypothetical protein